MFCKSSMCRSRSPWRIHGSKHSSYSICHCLITQSQLFHWSSELPSSRVWTAKKPIKVTQTCSYPLQSAPFLHPAPAGSVKKLLSYRVHSFLSVRNVFHKVRIHWLDCGNLDTLEQAAGFQNPSPLLPLCWGTGRVASAPVNEFQKNSLEVTQIRSQTPLANRCVFAPRPSWRRIQFELTLSPRSVISSLRRLYIQLDPSERGTRAGGLPHLVTPSCQIMSGKNTFVRRLTITTEFLRRNI